MKLLLALACLLPMFLQADFFGKSIVQNNGLWSFQTSAQSVVDTDIKGKDNLGVYLVTKSNLSGPAAIGNIQISPYGANDSSTGWYNTNTWLTANTTAGNIVYATITGVVARRARFWSTSFMTSGSVDVNLIGQ